MTTFYRLETLGDSNDDKLVVVEDYVAGLEMFDWKTKFGHRTSSEWPPNATITLRKSSGKKLTDLLSTIKNTLIVSPRVRAIIEENTKGTEIEYLPVMIYDYRKRLLSGDYVIVNPIGTFDCLDLEASDILWDEKDSTRALAVNNAVLSEKKLKNAPALFRVREEPSWYIVSFDIAKPIHDGDYTNVYWTKLELK
jgi:hypothetical protein